MESEKFVLKLDASQLEQFQVCPLSWYYKYKEHIRTSTPKGFTAANKGSLIHRMLEVFYQELNKGASRGQAVRAVQNRLVNEEWAKEYGLESEVPFLKERFFQYQAHYSESDFAILKDMQGKPAVEVGFSKVLFEDEKRVYIVEGRIDGITEISVGSAFVDHKTQGRAMLLYQYCPQFLTYSWATGLQWGIINYIRMHKEYDKKATFYKHLINFPPHLIQNWEMKMMRIFNKIESMIKSQVPPIHFYIERNESSCSGPFKSMPCQFTTLCEVDIADQRLYNIVKATQYKIVDRWSPWEEKEEE